MVAVSMGLGLLLEGLIGFKVPAYLEDATRRELFRLAHTHGTLLGLVLVAASFTSRRLGPVPRASRLALRVGAVAMPLGFFLGGIWHPEGEPGLAVWLVPPAGVLVLFGVITVALMARGRRPDPAG